ncbi:hypothetical protein DK842_09780 [Chromobacterium phragmitis]|uniref:Uncharacterized protein n=1 Tax=Chromobacterium phragmitis TaxID=2202141 RepID=A0ABV0IWT2_9NEIS|nr:hypothetical protein [Chromobacterium phragmitis]AXE30169.1 hypothetical protein DK842_09780 [Chromobacterium phragmitis]
MRRRYGWLCCLFALPAWADLPLDRLRADAPRELMLLDGGYSEGDPCQPWAWHGYNGIEARALGLAGAWMLAHGKH